MISFFNNLTYLLSFLLTAVLVLMTVATRFQTLGTGPLASGSGGGGGGGIGEGKDFFIVCSLIFSFLPLVFFHSNISLFLMILF